MEIILQTCIWLFISVGHSQTTMSPSNVQITTSPSPEELKDLCPGNVLTFTCETRDSPIIAWTSDDYIEARGTQLEFGRIASVGDTLLSPVNPNTSATLTENGVIDGVAILESQLRITLSPEYPSSNVACIHVGNGIRREIRFNLLADPDVPPTIRSHLQRDENGECIVFLSWDIPNNVDREDLSHFMVKINGEDRLNTNSTTTSYPHCNCDPHNISIASVNRCNRAGPSINTSTLNPDQASLIEFDRMECQTTTSTDTAFMVDPAAGFEIKCEIWCVFLMISIIGASLLSNFIFCCCCIYFKWKVSHKKTGSGPETANTGDNLKNEGDRKTESSSKTSQGDELKNKGECTMEDNSKMNQEDNLKNEGDHKTEDNSKMNQGGGLKTEVDHKIEGSSKMSQGSWVKNEGDLKIKGSRKKNGDIEMEDNHKKEGGHMTEGPKKDGSVKNKEMRSPV